jgi:chitinase
MQRDINFCKEQGVKVLLSIGGVYNPVLGSDYEVSSPENGVEFADFLWGAFGPFQESWTGPRPFDASPTEHTVVDGFDFDIEHRFPSE